MKMTYFYSLRELNEYIKNSKPKKITPILDTTKVVTKEFWNGPHIEEKEYTQYSYIYLVEEY